MDLNEKKKIFLIQIKKNGFYSWSGLSYFLYEYEESLRNQQSVKVQYSFAIQTVKSVEHILPQTLNASWKEILTEFTKFEKKGLIRNIGNLLLISAEKNSELKNNDYYLKRDSYKMGTFSENKVAKDYLSWGKDEIEYNTPHFLDRRIR